MKPVFLPANLDGCALYRMWIPHNNIPESKFVWRAVGGVPWETFSDCDTVLVQRQTTQQNYDAILQLKATGRRIIYDTDDNLWSLPAANPGKQVFEFYKEGFGRCASECHAITVSTQGLKTALKTAMPKYSGPILVCPNGVDLKLFRPPSVIRETDKVLIGWAGSNTHGEDVKEAWHVLPELVAEFPNLYMDFIGMAPPVKLIGHPRVRVKRFVPVGEFPSRFSTWAWDLTLAPLADNRFNKSKSCIKMLEAAAVGIPCLVSHVQTYEEFCALDPELRYLLCMTERHWREKLRELIQDKDKRNYYAERMRAVAVKWFDAAKLKDNWLHAMNSAWQ